MLLIVEMNKIGREITVTVCTAMCRGPKEILRFAQNDKCEQRMTSVE